MITRFLLQFLLGREGTCPLEYEAGVERYLSADILDDQSANEMRGPGSELVGVYTA